MVSQNEEECGSDAQNWNPSIYSIRAQVIFILVSIYLILLIGVIELIGEGKDFKFNDIGAFLGSMRPFFPDVESPVSLLLSLLSFQAALSIVIAAASSDNKKELGKFSNFSYISSIVSTAFVVLLCPSLFDKLQLAKTVLVMACAFIVLFCFGRFSITLPDREIREAEVKRYKVSESHSRDRAKNFRNIMTPEAYRKDSNPIFIAIFASVGFLLLIVNEIHLMVTNSYNPIDLLILNMSIAAYIIEVYYICSTDTKGFENSVSNIIIIIALESVPCLLMYYQNFIHTPPSSRISELRFWMAIVMMSLVLLILFAVAAFVSNTTRRQRRRSLIASKLITPISIHLSNIEYRKSIKYKYKSEKIQKKILGDKQFNNDNI